jgi:DnaJ-class molecular chaperone
MNRDPRGYYAALHVTPDTGPAEIQRAFRALMRLRHPDVEASSGAVPASGDTGAGDEVRRSLESYAVLRDPKSRAAYDPAGNASAAGNAASDAAGAAGHAVSGAAGAAKSVGKKALGVIGL